MKEYDVVVIGSGPAGLAAAIAAKKSGVDNIMLYERENSLGGRMNQAIESGYGRALFGKELTGPEFIQMLIDQIELLKIPYRLNTLVTDIDRNKVISRVSDKNGVGEVRAKCIIAASGCRERLRREINVPTKKYAGIYSVGTALNFITVEGYLPGKEIVILGSGDTGLNAARRLTIEGAKVNAVLEALTECTCTEEEIERCLGDFNIPLMLGHTIVDIKGHERVEGIVAAEIDDNKRPVKETEKCITCDTLLIAAGLFSESGFLEPAGVKLEKPFGGPLLNEDYQTSIEGVFACGDVVRLNKNMDEMVKECMRTGEKAAAYVKSL